MAAGPTVALYVLDEADPWAPAGAARWWLHHSLSALMKDLAALQVPLLLFRSKNVLATLKDLCTSLPATALHWNRCYEPYAIQRDKNIKSALTANLTTRVLSVESHNASLLHEPWTIKNQSGNFYRVYTPFSKACFAAGVSAPLPAPKAQAPLTLSIAGEDLSDWGLLPHTPDWAGGLRHTWQPGATGAQQRLAYICDTALAGYASLRDRPDLEQTSRLSPHLHWGEISPRQVWHAIEAACVADSKKAAGREKFLKELLWREFAYHLLYHQPQMPEVPLDARFLHFPWQPDAKLLRAWQRGETGFPIVDAGMRQLWQTGWMHNRVRMICASLLVKHLLQPWQAGAAWFWDTLVDADLANNSASWQWVAGCGADAAPYFRVFNPIIQGEKFDPNGDYVRQYVPELRDVPKEYIHKPWEWAGAAKLTYPAPVIDHQAGRTRALDALAAMGGSQFKDHENPIKEINE